MEVRDKDKFELEKRADDPMDYHSSASMSSDWQFSSANVANSSLGLMPVDVQIPVCRGDLASASSGPSASVVESFGPGPWDHPSCSQSLGFCGINVQNNISVSSTIGMGKGGPPSLRSGIDGTLDMGWHPSSSMLKSGILLPKAPGMLPQSLSHFPADSAFIERAARFSCFNGGSFSDMVNPLRIPESIGPYSRDGGVMHRPLEVFSGSELNAVSSGQAQKSVVNASEASRNASLPVDCVATEGSLQKNERRSEGLVRSLDETKQSVGGSGNESDEAEFSGGGGHDKPSMLEGNGVESLAKSLGAKKRKRNGQGKEIQQLGEAAKDNPEIQPKADQNPTSTTNKSTGKQGSQASDPPKEEYIHVRARRGQATNSHSLAERVRREKISERMKFLQDLVPGCSKVTGKAVMLDEIINYVQSLQRQVEFLSMKLATVNPRLDFNIEGLLAKDILQSRAVSSSTLAFSPDMSIAYPPLHPSQPGLIPASFPGMEIHADVLCRTMNTQLTPVAGGFKEPAQLPNAWDDELHNVVQMSYSTSTPRESQDVNAGTTPTGHMKIEL